MDRPRRYQITKQGCMPGYWRVVDTATDQTVVAGLCTKNGAAHEADTRNRRDAEARQRDGIV